MKAFLIKILKELNFNSSRKYLEEFVKEASSTLKDEGIVLDAGAGDQRHKKYFSKAKYESADICELERDYGDITYNCDLSSIPVEDERFDMVICTQVLEHVPNPEAVLLELHRVLKKNGTLWLTAPLFYEEHEKPYDFYRYTQFGYKELLKRTNFELNRIEWLEGYFMTLSYQLRFAYKYIPLNYKSYGASLFGLLFVPFMFALKVSFYFLSYLFARMDGSFKYTKQGMCKNYALVAKKK